MNSLEACLGDCPCVDTLDERSKWITSEYDKLESSYFEAASQLLVLEDRVSRQDDTINLLRNITASLKSRLEKSVTQLADERKGNSSLRAEVKRNEDLVFDLRRRIIPEYTVSWPHQFPAFI